MLSRWFRRSSRLEHANPQTRLEALADLDESSASAQQEALSKLAQHDSAVEVRQTAIALLQDNSVLGLCLQDPEVELAAAKRIAELLENDANNPNRTHPAVMQVRIAATTDTSLDALWPDLGTPEQCATLALGLRGETCQRVLAHPLLASEAGLGILLRTARGKDKFCHRYAKEQLDDIKSARQVAVELYQRACELDEAITKALKQAEPTAHTELIVYRQKLTKLGQMRTQVTADLNQACQSLISRGADITEFNLPEDQLSAVDLSIPAAAEDPFKPLQNQYAELAERMQQAQAVEEISDLRDELTQSWLEHADHFPPSPEQHAWFERISTQYQHYKQAHQRLAKLPQETQIPTPLKPSLAASAEMPKWLDERKRWLKRWQKPITSLNWPAGHELPSQAAQCSQDLERIQAELGTLQAWMNTAQIELKTLIDQASNAIEAGQIDAAKSHLGKARALQKSGLKQHDPQIAQLQSQLAEFRDWQEFATHPKREELVKAVSALAQAPLHPPEQAGELKALREQWRSLGRLASAEDHQLQQQFDEFADQAFAPCREYFNEQSEVRAKNLAAREQLCEQLATYLESTDWEHADMQAAEDIMRHARQEWHNYNPCDRKALKPVQTRFESLQDSLHGKVKNSWNANVSAKEDLVAQAKALLEAELNDQIAGAIKLQQQWREIGRTPRGPDQRLWREFRKTCDQIFAARDTANIEAKAEYRARLLAHEQAVERFEQACANEQSPSRKTLDQHLSEIETCAADLNIAANLRQRVAKASRAYEELLKTQSKAQQLTDLQQWQAWDESISQAEQAGETFSEPHGVFKARANGTAKPLDWLAMTLEAEIAADLSSPSEDQSRRMALQVELMNAGRRNLAEEDFKTMRNRWCEAGPKDSSADALRERFFKALQERLKK